MKKSQIWGVITVKTVRVDRFRMEVSGSRLQESVDVVEPNRRHDDAATALPSQRAGDGLRAEDRGELAIGLEEHAARLAVRQQVQVSVVESSLVWKPLRPR